jgi:flagellar hook-associated protein 1
MSLSIGLGTAVSALRAHQLAVDVASHNIANAQTPGFSRQRVLLTPLGGTSVDRYSGGSVLGQAGQGVDASSVNRMRDVFLDYQARQTLSSKGQFTGYSDPLSQAEVVFNDPSDGGISSLMAKFWASWQDLVNNPESSSARAALVNGASTLTTRLNGAFQDLTTQRTDLNKRVSSIADRINSAAGQVADLNIQVQQAELTGQNANDLRDRRDLLLDQLSSLGQITYNEQADKTVSVYLGNHELVSGTTTRTVSAIQDTANPGMNKLVFAADGAAVTTTTGELRGVLDARDVAFPALITKLNTLASEMIGSVNSIHKAGYGLNQATGLDFFSGTDAQSIALNPTLAASPNSIAAAAAPNAPGDGSNALAIANLQLAAVLPAGRAGTNLVVGSALRAGVTVGALSVAGSAQPGSYYLVTNGANLVLRQGSLTGPVVGTATLADIPMGTARSRSRAARIPWRPFALRTPTRWTTRLRSSRPILPPGRTAHSSSPKGRTSTTPTWSRCSAPR